MEKVPKAKKIQQSKEGGDQLPKSKHVYSELSRQLYNLDCSVQEFRRQSRLMEAESLGLKRKCRRWLKELSNREAWDAGKRCLIAERRGRLFTESASRVYGLVKLLRNAEDLDPAIRRCVMKLDWAVRDSDPERVKQLIDRLREEYDIGDEGGEAEWSEEPRDSEIGDFLQRLTDECLLRERLRASLESTQSQG